MEKFDFEYSFDFKVIQIVCSLPEHRLAWHMNKLLGIRLVKQEDVAVPVRKEGKILIDNYLFEEQHGYFRLIKNKAYDSGNIAKPFLISELKNFDYIVKLSDLFLSQSVDETLRALREIEQVTFAGLVNLDSIKKSKENLLLF